MTTAFNRIRYENDNGKMTAYAWPGGYPIFYLCEDGGILCPDCADCKECRAADVDTYDKQWHIVAADVHWEGEPLFCDNCNKSIDSAYGPVEGGAE